jgi:hypothetical protein
VKDSSKPHAKKKTNYREKSKMTPKVQKELHKVSGFELSNKYITKNMNNKFSIIMHKHGKVLSPLTKSEPRQGIWLRLLEVEQYINFIFGLKTKCHVNVKLCDPQ